MTSALPSGEEQATLYLKNSICPIDAVIFISTNIIITIQLCIYIQTKQK